MILTKSQCYLRFHPLSHLLSILAALSFNVRADVELVIDSAFQLMGRCWCFVISCGGPRLIHAFIRSSQWE